MPKMAKPKHDSDYKFNTFCMTNNNIVKIHGKDYVTVAGRLESAKEDIKSIVTEVISHPIMIVVKATVTTKKGIFTGISAANPSKSIEKQSPFEVAETSAVGRALGFAGYGVIDGIASADEMNKATVANTNPDPTESWLDNTSNVKKCEMHNKDLKSRGRGIWDHRARLNENKEYDENGNWYWCQGMGWHLSSNQ